MITKDDMILITGASGFIGTNLIELFEQKGYTFVNYDKADATKENQHQYWHKGNIMDKDALAAAFDKYKPSIVIHLAAPTDTLSDNLEDYIENTEGTKNVVDEIKKHVQATDNDKVYNDKDIYIGKKNGIKYCLYPGIRTIMKSIQNDHGSSFNSSFKYREFNSSMFSL